MPNQSGKIILVLLLIAVLAGFAIYFFLAPSIKKNSSEQTLENTRRADIGESSEQLLTCKEGLSEELIQDEVWNYLPEQIKEETYKKDIISAGQATYDIYVYEPSADCKYIPILVELIGRGAGAYTAEDFINRALYMYDLEAKRLDLVTKFDPDSFFDYNEFGSNLWQDSNYVFVVSEDIKNGQFTKTRYLYESQFKKLQKSVEQ